MSCCILLYPVALCNFLLYPAKPAVSCYTCYIVQHPAISYPETVASCYILSCPSMSCHGEFLFGILQHPEASSYILVHPAVFCYILLHNKTSCYILFHPVVPLLLLPPVTFLLFFVKLYPAMSCKKRPCLSIWELKALHHESLPSTVTAALHIAKSSCKDRSGSWEKVIQAST